MIETAMKSKRASARGRRKSGGLSLGCLAWIVLVAVLAALAWALREPVMANVQKVVSAWQAAGKSGASGDGAAGSADHTATRQPPATGPAAPSAETSAGTSSTTAPSTAPSSPAKTPSAGPTSSTAAPSPAAAPPKTTPPKTSPSPVKAPAARVPVAPATRTARLYFVLVGPDGGTSLAGVDRSLPTSDSPLRDVIASLFTGPSAGERDRGLATMIPVGAALRSVVMKGDTAVIDVSEGFRYNAGGREGMKAGLRQVVWAATEFPTVRAVQMLIDGKRVEYLGPEGVAVGDPLDRSSFAD